jgi:hypothetical protein
MNKIFLEGLNPSTFYAYLLLLLQLQVQERSKWCSLLRQPVYFMLYLVSLGPYALLLVLGWSSKMGLRFDVATTVDVKDQKSYLIRSLCSLIILFCLIMSNVTVTSYYYYV